MRKGSGSPMCIDCGVRPRMNKTNATCHECHQKRYAYRLGKKCPDCGKSILDRAKTCRRCWALRIQKKNTRKCAYCGKPFVARKHPTSIYCGHSCANLARPKKPFNPETFWSKVDCQGPDDCWLWQAGTHNGYGAFYFRGQNKPAHCVAYILTFGKIPKDKLLRHTCDNRLCVNPNHLIPGTHWDNMHDMAEHRRRKRGLSPDEVAAIRVQAKQRVPYRTIAKNFGVSEPTISNILNGYLHQGAG